MPFCQSASAHALERKVNGALATHLPSLKQRPNRKTVLLQVSVSNSAGFVVTLQRYTRYTRHAFTLSPRSHTCAPICSGWKFLLAQTCEVLLGSVDNRGGDPG